MADSLRTWKGPSLFIFGYYWLSVATIDLVDDNKEFEVSGIFSALIPIVGSW